MARHLERALEGLKDKLKNLGETAASRVEDAALAVLGQRADAAQRVITGDRVIDDAEVEIEEECLRLLALYQPVAQDLRFVISALKVNNELERVGDLAASIAARSKLVNLRFQSLPIPLDKLFQLTVTQLKNSLQAFLTLDTSLARVVWNKDEEINALHRQNYDTLQEVMRSDKTLVDGAVSLLSISRNFERIGDHSTNISEDVIYLIDGEIVRHRKI